MILVTGHNYPFTDADSIISSLVLAEILNIKNQPAQAILLNENAIQPSTLQILLRAGSIPLPRLAGPWCNLQDNQLAMVDHNNPAQSFGMVGTKKEPYIIIDHHADIGTNATHKTIERVGATCTLITRTVKEESIPIGDIFARALLYGIACDTKGFKGRKTSQEDLRAADYLYRSFNIGASVEQIAADALVADDVSHMPVQQILRSSLKEYQDGEVGIATIEVLNNEYHSRLQEMERHAWRMPYNVFALMIFKFHTSETEVLIFDKKYPGFPQKRKYNSLISRAQQLVPEILGENGEKYDVS